MPAVVMRELADIYGATFHTLVSKHKYPFLEMKTGTTQAKASNSSLYYQLDTICKMISSGKPENGSGWISTVIDGEILPQID